jgi:hypothetical protein
MTKLEEIDRLAWLVARERERAAELESQLAQMKHARARAERLAAEQQIATKYNLQEGARVDCDTGEIRPSAAGE